MNLSFRTARLADVPSLWHLRRESILELAPRGIKLAQAVTWAAKLTIQEMEQRFLETEIWVAEADDIVIGWIALRYDYIDGLYIDPRFARRGVGTKLLCLAERLMSERTIQIVRLEASLNAEQFYSRRGYLPMTVRGPNEAVQMEKQL